MEDEGVRVVIAYAAGMILAFTAEGFYWRVIRRKENTPVHAAAWAAVLAFVVIVASVIAGLPSMPWDGQVVVAGVAGIAWLYMRWMFGFPAFFGWKADTKRVASHMTLRGWSRLVHSTYVRKMGKALIVFAGVSIIAVSGALFPEMRIKAVLALTMVAVMVAVSLFLRARSNHKE